MKTKATKKKRQIDFNSLSKSEKRVLIATDVIKQLNTRQLIAEAGRYVQLPPEFSNSELSIKDNYVKIKECKVCALGACLMATTKFANVLGFDDVGKGISEINNEDVKKIFGEIFEPRQLLLIEQAFEGVSKSASRFAKAALQEDDLSRVMEDRCDSFFKEHGGRMFDEKATQRTSSLRLKAIMKNIIKNNGTFKP